MGLHVNVTCSMTSLSYMYTVRLSIMINVLKKAMNYIMFTTAAAKDVQEII